MVTYHDHGWSPIGSAARRVRRRRYVNADNYVTNYVLTFSNDTFSADIKWINELELFVVLSLRNDRRLSEINARGLWHAIHFNLRFVSFMPRDNDGVLVPLLFAFTCRSRSGSPVSYIYISTPAFIKCRLSTAGVTHSLLLTACQPTVFVRTFTITNLCPYRAK